MEAGETVIAVEVEELLQAYVPPPLAVSVAEPPGQNEGFTGLIAATGIGFTVTVTVAGVLLHPFTE